MIALDKQEIIEIDISVVMLLIDVLLTGTNTVFKEFSNTVDITTVLRSFICILLRLVANLCLTVRNTVRLKLRTVIKEV